MTEQRMLGRKDITAEVRRIQAMFGTLYGGSGTVKVCGEGIEIVASTTFADSRSYKFVDASGDVVARLGAVHDDTVDDYRSVDMRTLPHAGLDAAAWVVAESPTGEVAMAAIMAEHSTGARDATTVHDVSATSSIYWVIDEGWMGSIEDGHIYMALDDNVTAGDDVRLQADWEVTYIASTRASKTNITDYTVDRAKFARLKPSSYNAISKPDAIPMVGLIAEDVDEVFPDLVIRRGPRPTDPRKKDQEP